MNFCVDSMLCDLGSESVKIAAGTATENFCFLLMQVGFPLPILVLPTLQAFPTGNDGADSGRISSGYRGRVVGSDEEPVVPLSDHAIVIVVCPVDGAGGKIIALRVGIVDDVIRTPMTAATMRLIRMYCWTL